ncbi:MAG: hypothetical protein NTX49_09625 [Chlamydiae bacterium]|nr:hypothetical protein [Chlamydiota bacterium]
MSLSATSRELLRTPEEIRYQIDLIVGKAKTDPLTAQVLTLLKEYRDLSPSDLPSVKSRVSAWIRQPTSLVETSNAVAQATARTLDGAGNLSGSAPASATSLDEAPLEIDLSSTELDPTILRRTCHNLHKKYCGFPESCIPEIVDITLQYAESWKDKKPMILLEDALSFLGKENLSTQAAFHRLFLYMIEKMKAREPFIDLLYVVGLLACQSNRLDVLFHPLHEGLGTSAPVPKKLDAVTIASKEANTLIVTDNKDLESAYQKGCSAANHLAQTCRNSSYISCNYFAVILNDIYSSLSLRELNKIEILFKEKRTEALKKLEKDHFYKRIPVANRIAIYLQRTSFYKEMVKAEHSLKEIQDKFFEYLLFISPQITDIERRIEHLSKIDEISEKLSHQFSMFKTHEKFISNFNSLLISYLEEVIIKTNQSMHYRNLFLYLNYLPYDDSVDWTEVSSKGLLQFLTQYHQAHSKLDFTSIPEPTRSRQIGNEEIHEDLNRRLTAFQALLIELQKTHEGAQRQSKDDLLRLGALVKAGLISQRNSGKVSFSLPTKGGVIDDDFGNTFLVTGPVSPIPAVPVAVCASATEKAEGEAPAAPVRKAADEEPEAATTIREASSGLHDVLLHARTHNRFTTTSAKQAFSNALHYADSLCALLADLEGREIQSSGLALIQQDIATCSFYACEQLLTAILHEKPMTGLASTPKAFYEDLGHNLMGRFLQAELSQHRELQQIVPILRNLEGVGAAVLNPFSFHGSQPLLQNVPSLLSKGTIEANPLEVRRSLSLGQETLQVFFHLLPLGGQDPRFTRSNINSYLLALSSAFIPPQSMGGKKSSAVDDRARGGSSKTAPETRPIDEMISIIDTALDPSQASIITEARQPAIFHNLIRLKYFRKNISDRTKRSLLPFYANQIRFVLRNVLEEFLSAACEKKIDSFDQIAARHDLRLLASQIGLFGRLSSDEKSFLQQSAGARNEARYGFKTRAPSFMRSSAAGSAAEAVEEEISGEFIDVLSRDYERIPRLIDSEIAMALAICSKITQHSFSDAPRS